MYQLAKNYVGIAIFRISLFDFEKNYYLLLLAIQNVFTFKI